jgi:hypothetical protein
MVRFTSLSQRAARDSTIMNRQAEDCAAQDETVKKLIEALKLQEFRVVSTRVLQKNCPNNGHHPDVSTFSQLCIGRRMRAQKKKL